MNTAGVIVLVIFLLLVAAGVGWVVFTRLRAKRLGLPPPPLTSYIPFLKSSSSSSYGPPQPAPGGIIGWFNDRIRGLKDWNSRTATGAYEGGGSGVPRGGRRGFGPLDPDEAWDARVGHEADGPYGYYAEEQELGLAPQHGQHHNQDTSYGGGSSYRTNLPTDGHNDDDLERGRTRSRSPGYGGGNAGLAVPSGGKNPFEDDAEPSNMSLRGVSPRPLETTDISSGAAGRPGHKRGKSSGGGRDDSNSPTERRSIFREDV